MERVRRTFSREFKLEAVKLVTERGVTVAQAAKDLDLHENVLRKRVRELRAAPQEELRAQAATRQRATELEAKRQAVISATNWSDLPRELRPAKARNIQDALNQRAAEPQAIPPAIASAMMFVVTTPTVPGREIALTLDIVASECAYGMNLFKDFFADITDVVGGRSGSTLSVLADARRKVLDEMRNQAYAIGADAIVAVKFDFNEFSGGGKSMLFVAGTGTAVRLAVEGEKG